MIILKLVNREARVEYKGLWQSVLGELEVNLSKANFSTWFKHTGIISSQDGHVVIAVPNIFTKEWLQKKYDRDIQSALSKVVGAVDSVEYKVRSAGAVETPTEARPQTAAPLSPTSVMPASHGHQPGLNTKYSFESFVVGAGNELAYAAAQAVAKSPGQKYNPLFIYGGVGLGKTHLIQAIGSAIVAADPSKKIQYCSSESFTNEFVSSISRKRTQDFAGKYRNVDVLIIDDMQFLAGKEKTQEEFFHTFNALHQANKQIIISSDKPPKAIPTLEERLRSRFEWGMTADIQPPDLETRQAILQAKSATMGISLAPEIIEYLAQQVRTNIRELEGALTQLAAYCELHGTECTLETAMQIIGAAGPRRRRLPSAKSVIDKVAEYFDVTAEELIGPKRDKEIVLPRQVSMYLLRHELSLSYPKIAQLIGGRDHTTAMHSVTKVTKQLEINDNLRSQLGMIKDKLWT